MAPAELSVANFTALCAKSEGRDKAARFCQYAARFIVGMCGTQPLKAGTQLHQLNELAGNVMKQLAGARRTHRWCKEFPVIQAILQSLPTIVPQQLSAPVLFDKMMDLVQKVTLATFLCIDHVGWLKQMKILSGGKRAGTGTIQLGLKFFCVSNFIGMVVNAKKYLETEAGDKRKKAAENAIKHGFLVVQTAHLSRAYESHDALVGFLGMITSGMDVMAQWPEEKKAPAKAS
eukprot:TRINITY_DN24958_c0_g1_i1.p1 TRINITY_DN24958_c0_g1~~TRINITY_DN24958_c0_g1_i1.p1  ORF type:complete len:267 (-),score=59.12 TRINITY_DN24958_c0_g1_i1:61-756(-)